MKYVSPKDSEKYCETGMVFGSGTFISPLYGDFRKILSSQPPCETLQLMPTDQPFCLRPQWDQIDFDNRSGECLSPGLHLRGAGRMCTFIRYHNTPDNSVATFRSGYDGIEMSDLTVDAAARGDEKWSRCGIVLSGSNCTIQRVGTRRTSGCADTGSGINGSEGFSLVVGEPLNTGGVITSLGQRNNRIEDCVVTEMLGDYVNGVGCSSRDSVLRGNYVNAKRAATTEEWVAIAPGHHACYNIGLCDNLVFANNVAVGGTRSVYAEQTLIGCRFENNLYRECGYSAYHLFLREPMRDCVFSGDSIITNGNTGGSAGYTFWSTRDFATAPIESIVISDAIILRGAGSGSEVIFPLNIEPGDNARDVLFARNVCGPGSQFKGMDNVSCVDNRSANGDPLEI